MFTGCVHLVTRAVCGRGAIRRLAALDCSRCTYIEVRASYLSPNDRAEYERTQVLIEQTTAVAPERLGALVGHVSRDELDQISEALRLAFALD